MFLWAFGFAYLIAPLTISVLMFLMVIGDPAMEEWKKRKRMRMCGGVYEKHSSTLQLTMFHFLSVYICSHPRLQKSQYKIDFCSSVYFCFCFRLQLLGLHEN